MYRKILAVLLAVVCLSICPAVAAEKWELGGGQGRKIDDGVLEITGTGDGGTSWLSEPVAVESGGTYRFSMEACSPTGGGGSAPCGLLGFSRDFTGLAKDWKSFSFIFQAPPDRKESRMRVGQWSTTQTFRFRKMKLEPVLPIYRGLASSQWKGHYLTLGDGEMIRNGKYRFNGSFGGIGANALRPFVSTTTGFNSNRFTFGGGQEAVFAFGFIARSLNPPSENEAEVKAGGIVHTLRSRTVDVNVNYHVRGECVVSAYAFDGFLKEREEIELGRIDKVGTIRAEIPDTLHPGSTVYIVIKGGPDASFQVDGVNFEAKIDTDVEGVGETVFADVLPQTDEAPEGYSSKPLFFDEQRTLYVEHRNDSDNPVKPFVTNPPSRMSRRYDTFTGPFDAEKVELPAKSICIETKPYSKAPEYRLGFSDKILKYSFRFDPYRDADFGYLPSGKPPASGLWWAEPDWKVSPTKAIPARKSENIAPIRMTAAGNDYESFQLVVNGEETGRQNVVLTVDGDLHGPDGATIPAKNVELRYAYYHFVHRPTDKAGSMGDWPDALPPLENPIDVKPNRNQPFWVTVYVPESAAAGLYEGKLNLRYMENGNDVDVSVPFELNVWDFALPRRNTLQTAYGRNIWQAFKYHNCKTEEDRRAVLELYHELYSRYRISTYDPVPLDPVRVSWDKESLKANVDFSAFDREMARVVEKYDVTGFRLRIEGMGWGTYEGSVPGKIAGFEEGTPEYEAMFSDYVKKLEAHLKEKGWLDMAYVYWFDEPEPKDYEFVAKGFAKLQKHAPGLARMITEEPNADFIDALEKEGVKIDIWCPVSYNFNDDEVKARQALGEKFWWYVCTGPKEPYCTLFIDHPGIELRMWHWQTWQRNIVGALIWESVYWSSASAFPDGFQNPYDDPMGYVAGGPKGSKRYWGNGDGRFVYPPLDAAVPGRNGGNVVLKRPVSSIRWEMIREGVEDYEMLVMLRNLREKHPETAERIDTLLTIPAGITANLTEFTVDPAPVYQRRKQIAELIETILKKAQ